MGCPGIFRTSIVIKIGAIFVLLALLYSAFLFTTVRMTKQLIGVGAAIDEAGAQRMRVYKMGLLINSDAASDLNRQAIRDEQARWWAVFEGLRQGTAAHGSVVDVAPVAGARLQQIEQTWTDRLDPIIEGLLQREAPNALEARQDYLREADALVSALSELVTLLQQHAATKIARLYWVQISFLALTLAVIAVALLALHQEIRVPIGRLTRMCRRVTSDGSPTASHSTSNELTALSQLFEGIIERDLHNRDQIHALHSTAQEISSLGVLSLEEVLKRIVDRAAELIHADQAAIVLKHPFMDCWVIEAASGDVFKKIRTEILLFEETPFLHQVYVSRSPATIDDLSCDADRPVRLRDEFHAKSFLGVPLSTSHECIGVLALMSTKSVRHFLESDVRVAQQFASYAAVLVENARLFDAVESESRQLKEKLTEVRRQVAELTHEVKAPAGRVAQCASWIEKDYGHHLDEKGLRYLHWIQKEGRDLASLANRTLDWTRITQAPLSIEPVDLRAVVEEVLESLGEERSSKNVHITVASDLPRLACQRIHAKQVVENLLSNAIKYSGGQPEILIEIGWGMRNEEAVLFVQDNGRGIEPAMAEQIFLPFRRLATDQPGHGIGLSIVKTVLEHYGGRIWVDSRPGQGSIFYFTLPVLRPDPRGREPVSPHAPQETNRKPNGVGGRL